MTLVASEYTIFKGLLPGIDRKRIEAPYVVDGTNFFVDIKGPVAGFGTTWFLHDEIAEPRGVQTLKTLDLKASYLFVADSINAIDIDSQQAAPVFTHAIRTEYWPWSRANVGGILYFANKEIGLVAFDPVAGTWSIITGSNIPTTIRSLCVSFGRLVLLSDTAIHWSKIEDGSNDGFLPSTSTGAGFQLLSIVCSANEGLVVLPYAQGFLTYTCKGILRSEFTNTPNPFRHDILSADHELINPWCVIRVGEKDREQHHMLTKRGLFTTFGDAKPEAWQPIMGEYLHRDIIPHILTGIDDMTFRLDHDFDKGWVMLSISSDSRNSLFSHAYVYYVPSQEWGIYNRAHTGFGNFKLSRGTITELSFSVISSAGVVSWFSDTDSNRNFPTLTGAIIDHKIHVDIPARYAGITAVNVMPTMMLIDTEDISQLTTSGIFDLEFELSRNLSPIPFPAISDTPDDSGTPVFMRTAMLMQHSLRQLALAPVAHTEAPLDASILVGPFLIKVEDKVLQEAASITQLQNAVIGMLDSGIADNFVDYIADFTDEVIEDWNTAIGDEDWGEASGDNTEYTIRFIGTLDGYETWKPNNIPQDIEPTLIEQIGRTRHLAGTISGVYLYLEITAMKIGEIFHLRHLLLNMTTAGRLF